jgi:biotin carboxyl carrier protein
MTFDVDVNGRVRVVSVEAAGPAGQFRVVVHDEAGARGPAAAVVVEARRTDLGLSLRYLDDGRVVDAAVTERPSGDVLVQLPHVDVAVVVDGRRSRRTRSEAGGAGVQRVTAPMPGRVVRILVSPGDEVGAGQAVVVIEAMKMENELKVLRAGRVREVLVTAVSSVEAGRLLVVVE